MFQAKLFDLGGFQQLANRKSVKPAVLLNSKFTLSQGHKSQIIHRCKRASHFVLQRKAKTNAKISFEFHTIYLQTGILSSLTKFCNEFLLPMTSLMLPTADWQHLLSHVLTSANTFYIQPVISFPFLFKILCNKMMWINTTTYLGLKFCCGFNFRQMIFRKIWGDRN